MRTFIFGLFLFTMVVRAVESSETVFEDSFSEKEGRWKTWSPRDEIAPEFKWSATIGRSAGGSLMISGDGDPAHYGSWMTHLTDVEPGAVYRFEVWYRAQGMDNEARSVITRLNWQNEKGRQVRPPDFVEGHETVKGWTRVEYVTDAPADAHQLEVQLSLGFAAEGIVWWDDLSFTKVKRGKDRKVRVATIHHKVRGSKSVEENLDQYISLIDEAALERPDIICLPEGITTVGNPYSYAEVSEPVPGPTTFRLGEAAQRHNTYIVAGIYEREGETVYNTSVLIDRKGELAGVYRKTHLPREEWEGGIAPGDSYPVFDTDFGKIGMIICWDVHFPEPSRAMALQGADLLLLPIWGGNETLTRARAIENHVYLVSSSYGMRSFILDPMGEVVAEAVEGDPVVVAEIDLDKQYFQQWLGNMKHRTWKERRPDIRVEN